MTDDLDRARAFIAKARWVFAKTLEWAPHEYTVRGDCARAGLDAEFAWLRSWILEVGYDRFDSRWPWRTWRTIDVDEHYYWLDTRDHLINRARHDAPGCGTACPRRR